MTLKMRTLLLVGGLLATLVGCSSENFTSVSGTVTLDGKPYGKAAVNFQPMGDKDNPNPGRGSSAYTDENGHFELKSDGSTEGAIVGKHRVIITTRAEAQADPTVSSPDGGGPPPPRDPIPVEWRMPGKEFVVPPGGTDKANFDIFTKKS